MIEVGSNYRIRAEKYCWSLEVRSDGKDKHGVHKDQWTPYYYPTFDKVAGRIIDVEAKHATSLRDLVTLMENVKDVLTKEITKVNDSPEGDS